VKDHLAELVRAAATPVHARNVVREYLQARILGAFQRAGAFIPLAFHGGTALRFLYSIPRWSEDLDFALEGPRDRYDLRGWLEAARAELEREAYAVEVAKVSDARVVHSAFVRFRGLFHELHLSGHRDETIAVKIEADTRPPAGARTETTIVRRHVLLRLHHHDKASLLAGKLHAVLERAYPKGRDLFDLLWYLGDRSWPGPNLDMLNAALRQTGWKGKLLTAESWRELAWKEVIRDVEPFIERGTDLGLLTKENLLALL
jgi:hypothetical protein